MIDFHSHILPKIDDGSQSINMSLRMLRRSFSDGVDIVVATPHCYLDYATCEDFLSDREYSLAELKKAMDNQSKPFPKIVLGAEVYWSSHMSKLKNLDKLCIEGTNYILIEPPYHEWTDDVFEELYRVINLGFRPIIAHLDRFLDKENRFSDLLSLDVLCQINADSFLNKKTRRKILDLILLDAAHVIGSDMHNLTQRPPNMSKAYDAITNKFGKRYAEFFEDNAQRILRGLELPPMRLPSIGLIKKIML